MKRTFRITLRANVGLLITLTSIVGMIVASVLLPQHSVVTQVVVPLLGMVLIAVGVFVTEREGARRKQRVSKD